jgi:hypothetical protein
MLDALMYPPAELLDTLRVLYVRQGNEVDDETIFATACARCLEAFSLAVLDNASLLGGIEPARKFWEGWACLCLIAAGMPWTYKQEDRSNPPAARCALSVLLANA